MQSNYAGEIHKPFSFSFSFSFFEKNSFCFSLLLLMESTSPLRRCCDTVAHTKCLSSCLADIVLGIL